MPFWKRESPEEKQQRERKAAEQAESVTRLEHGHLPLNAERRLREQSDRLFTSNLSVSEFLLTREAGFQPIGQVMGSCFYKVGWFGTLSLQADGELPDLTSAQREARRLAINRLKQEATLLGAHGVVGVSLQLAGYDWSQKMIEFTAVGTAIRIPDMAPRPEPFLCTLSGQEFWTLWQAGYQPTAITMGVSVSLCCTSSETRKLMNSIFQGASANQEIKDFTQVLYNARHAAMRRMHEEGAKSGGNGIVGVELKPKVELVECGNNEANWDLLVEFLAIGTAITNIGYRESSKPDLVLDLAALKARQ